MFVILTDSIDALTVEKGGTVAKVVLSTLAQMNEKLSVIEKSMAKPLTEDTGSEDEDNDLSFLPVRTIDDFDKFERNLKQDKAVFRKLVCSCLFIMHQCHHLRFVSNRY